MAKATPNAALLWDRVNPDTYVDRLPQPFRMCRKILEEVLAGVDDAIFHLEELRKDRAYEHNLASTKPTGCLPLMQTVNVLAVANHGRGTRKVVAGTAQGRVVLVNTADSASLDDVRPFPEGDEEVVILEACSTAEYEKHPWSPKGSATKPPPSVMVVGSKRQEVYIYAIRRKNKTTIAAGMEAVGLSTHCRVLVENAPADTEGGNILAATLTGTVGVQFLSVLLRSGVVHVFAIPLPAPDPTKEELAKSGVSAIAEEDEDEDGEGVPRANEPETSSWDEAVEVTVPLYVLPSRDWVNVQDTVMKAIAVHGTKDPSVSVFMYNTGYTTLIQSVLNVPKPPPLPDDASIEQIIGLETPELGSVSQPAESTTLGLAGQWPLPSRVTASAASWNGHSFAAGTEDGTLVLFSTPLSSVRRCCSGHYAEVKAISFHKNLYVCSVGVDGFMHVYACDTGNLTFRTLNCPPRPGPPPHCLDVVACESIPAALVRDDAHNVRLYDLRLGKKIAIVKCEPPNKDDPHGQYSDMPPLDPVSIVTADGAICMLAAQQKMEQDQEESDAGGEAENPEPESSQPVGNDLILTYGIGEMLEGLFPGIESRAREGTTAEVLFAVLSDEARQIAVEIAEEGDRTKVKSTTKRKTMKSSMRASRFGSQRSASGVSGRSGGWGHDTSGSAVDPSFLIRKAQLAATEQLPPKKSVVPGLGLTATKSASPGGDGGEAPVSARLTAANLEQQRLIMAQDELGPGVGTKAMTAEDGNAAVAPVEWRTAITAKILARAGNRKPRELKAQRRLEAIRRELAGA